MASGPYITQNLPATTYADASGNVTLSVQAYSPGNSTIAYQWRRVVNGNAVALAEGGVVSGSRTATLTLTNADSSYAGGYFLTLTDASGTTTSSSAQVVVNNANAPTFTQQPASVSAAAGQSATFTATASGATSYQWYRLPAGSTDPSKGGVALGGNYVSGQTTNSLTLNNVTANDGAGYFLVAHSANGTAISTVATLTVVTSGGGTGGSTTGTNPPTITQQPGNVLVNLYGNASFAVTATTTTGTLTYQWYFAASASATAAAITAATAATYTITGVQDSNAGLYYCVVGNGTGSTAQSQTVTLTITDSAVTVPGSATGFSLTPYPGGYTPASTIGNFYRGGQTTPGGYYANVAVGNPIALGSAALQLLTPVPGAVLRINEFGLDEIEREWMCASIYAAALKPEPRDADPYLMGMYCVTSSVTDGEGKMSTVRATYKGLVSGKTRPSERRISTNTDSQTLTIQTGTSSTGGTGFGATSGDNTTIPNIPVPVPIFSLRGAAINEPDMTSLGEFFAAPARAPQIPATFIYPVFAQTGIGQKPVQIGSLTFSPDPRGWLCDRLEYNEAALHFEVTQQWRIKYVLTAFSLPAISSPS